MKHQRPLYLLTIAWLLSASAQANTDPAEARCRAGNELACGVWFESFPPEQRRQACGRAGEDLTESAPIVPPVIAAFDPFVSLIVLGPSVDQEESAIAATADILPFFLRRWAYAEDLMVGTALERSCASGTLAHCSRLAKREANSGYFKGARQRWETLCRRERLKDCMALERVQTPDEHVNLLESVCATGAPAICHFAESRLRPIYPERANRVAEQSCDRGDGHACWLRGLEYDLADDNPNAERWYRKGCERGNSASCPLVGMGAADQ